MIIILANLPSIVFASLALGAVWLNHGGFGVAFVVMAFLTMHWVEGDGTATPE